MTMKQSLIKAGLLLLGTLAKRSKPDTRFQCALQHCLDHDIDEGRQRSAD